MKRRCCPTGTAGIEGCITRHNGVTPAIMLTGYVAFHPVSTLQMFKNTIEVAQILAGGFLQVSSAKWRGEGAGGAEHHPCSWVKLSSTGTEELVQGSTSQWHKKGKPSSRIWPSCVGPKPSGLHGSLSPCFNGHRLQPHTAGTSGKPPGTDAGMNGEQSLAREQQHKADH